MSVSRSLTQFFCGHSLCTPNCFHGGCFWLGYFTSSLLAPSARAEGRACVLRGVLLLLWTQYIWLPLAGWEIWSTNGFQFSKRQWRQSDKPDNYSYTRHRSLAPLFYSLHWPPFLSNAFPFWHDHLSTHSTYLHKFHFSDLQSEWTILLTFRRTVTSLHFLRFSTKPEAFISTTTTHTDALTISNNQGHHYPLKASMHPFSMDLFLALAISALI